MFLFRDAHIALLMGVAIGIGGLGMYLMRRFGLCTIDGQSLPIERKPYTPGNIWGGLIFGTGWAITGTCPGTALSQLGKEKLMAAFTISGILLGNLLYRKIGDRVLERLGGARQSVGTGVQAETTS